MSEFDHDRISALLNIVAQCAGHSGKLGALSAAAMHELMDANEAIKQGVLAKRQQDEAARQAAQAVPEDEEQAPAGDEDPAQRPFVHPSDSQTATIADRRL
jgi:hypothetical protein